MERKTYTFQEMRTLRAHLNSLIQQEKVKVKFGHPTQEARIYGRLKAALDKDIEDFGANLPTDLKKKFDVATAFYRDQYKEIFANKTVARLGQVARENPEDVYKMLIKAGDVNDIRRVKRAVGDDGFQKVRRRFVEDLVTGKQGEILGAESIVKKMADYGPETLREVLSPSQLDEVTRYTKTRTMPRFIESEVEKKVRSLIYQGGSYRAPEEVVERVVNGDAAIAKAVRRVVGTTRFNEYRRIVWERIIGEPPPVTALPGVQPTPTAARMVKTLRSYDESFLKEMFTQDELAHFEKIDDAKALMESQKRLMENAPQTAAAILAPAAGAGAGAMLYTNPVTGVATVLTAGALARLYVSEAGRKLFIRGLDPKFARDAHIAAQLGALIARQSVEAFNEDRQKQGLPKAGK